ncbi:Iron dicitrate transport regulator FecR [Planctomycetales bacterium 10988]|nr:Iron dicitrate transport regulator FecR [Planctomycetales bacterium 10988]
MNAKLDQLIADWLDGRLSKTDRQELEQRLRKESEARRRLLHWTALEDSLREQLEAAPVELSPEKTSSISNVQPTAGSRWMWPLSLLALAATFLMALAWLPTTSEIPVVAKEVTIDSGCAVFVESYGVEPLTLASKGELIPPGNLQFDAGMVRLDFLSGVAMTLAGPAEIELISPSEARLIRGKIRVRVSPAGRGFTLHTPGRRVIDLGTEFGLSVDPKEQTSFLHVFDGEVELAEATATSARQRIPQGESRSWNQSAVDRSNISEKEKDPSIFPSEQVLRQAVAQQRSSDLLSWNDSLQQRAAEDERLIALYSFRVNEEHLIENLVGDFGSDGGIVGAKPASGRFTDEGALEFKRPGDRVRVVLQGEYPALTFACWVRLDGLDRRYNALYLTDGYERDGEPHWQIFHDGTLMFSVRSEQEPGVRRNSMHYSKPFFTIDRAGQWFHLAASFEVKTGRILQYVNGERVGDAYVPAKLRPCSIRYGTGEIGNWGLPGNRNFYPVRNLNGRVDEFSFYRTALSGEEIRTLYEEGKPRR